MITKKESLADRLNQLIAREIEYSDWLHADCMKIAEKIDGLSVKIQNGDEVSDDEWNETWTDLKAERRQNQTLRDVISKLQSLLEGVSIENIYRD
jgi:DNA repair exonuclease SbcCD ATPase subunit